MIFDRRLRRIGGCLIEVSPTIQVATVWGTKTEVSDDYLRATPVCEIDERMRTEIAHEATAIEGLFRK